MSTHQSHQQISNHSDKATGDTFGGLTPLSAANRPRFDSAPALVVTNRSSSTAVDRSRSSSQIREDYLDEPPLSTMTDRSLWECIIRGGKQFHRTSRRYVETHAPVRWHESILTTIDVAYQFVDTSLFQRAPPTIRLTRENCLEQLKLWIVCIVSGLAAVVLILASFSLVASFASRLALPFYAIYGVVYWSLVWKSSSNGSSSSSSLSMDSPPPLLTHYWWCVAAVAELVLLSIRHFVIGEAFLGDSSSIGGLIDQLIHYCVIIVAFGGAKLYLDNSMSQQQQQRPDRNRSIASSPSYSMTGDQFTYLFAYLLLTYAVRYFALRGFTLLPNALRPFLAYVAGHTAVLAFRKKAPWWSWWTGLGTEANLTDRSGSHPSLFTAGLHPKSSGPAASNRYHGLPPETELLRFASSRNSRRVSLPAGSLVPTRDQSNIAEARGLIADMLAHKDMPPYLVSGLRAVSSLLLPTNNNNNNQSNNFFFSSHLDFLGKLPRVLDTPYMGVDATLANVESVGHRRSSPIVVTWSTTTSATGLPTVEPEPSRARSSSYWKHRHLTETDEEESQPTKEIVVPTRSIELDSSLILLTDGTLFSLSEMENDPKLSRLEEWSLPIFDLYADSPDTVLTRLAYTIFKRSEFFRIFRISKEKFFSFFHALEKGYWEIPYHNRIHAADVMHGVYYFATSKVPALSIAHDPYAMVDQRRDSQSIAEETASECNGGGGDEEKTDDESHSECPSGGGGCLLPNGLFEGLEAFDDKKDQGSLASVLSSLEVMALYTAAAMHDYDHPGRTNAYLVAIEDEKAILYNDRSVLENHHAAASWKLLCRPEYNFVEHLDAAEFKRFRYMIIEAILATDLKRHFEILMDFNGKVGSSRGLDWDNESDKLLTCQICIKMADINSPTKPYPLHREWTNRIVEEFYAQGDDERRRGIPVSPYMDRGDAQLAKLQDSFITHLVAPLAQAMSDGGLLTSATSSTNTTAAAGRDETNEASTTGKSELMINLECNQKYWKAQLDDAVETTHSENGGGGGTSVASSEMETIQEQEDETSSTPVDTSL